MTCDGELFLLAVVGYHRTTHLKDDFVGITGLNGDVTPDSIDVRATSPEGTVTQFKAVVRIDTPGERHYYTNGGIMAGQRRRPKRRVATVANTSAIPALQTRLSATQ